MKLKLKPSQRTKRHYLLIKGKRDEIEQAILEYVGILGWARASPIFIPKDKETLIVALERKETNNIRASFEISGFDIKVLKVSGTLKGIKK